MGKLRALWKLATRLFSIALMGYVIYLLYAAVKRVTGLTGGVWSQVAGYALIALIGVLCLQNVWDDIVDIRRSFKEGWARTQSAPQQEETTMHVTVGQQMTGKNMVVKAAPLAPEDIKAAEEELAATRVVLQAGTTQRFDMPPEQSLPSLPPEPYIPSEDELVEQEYVETTPDEQQSPVSEDDYR